MERQEIVNKIGIEYLKSNLETGEWSYPKALRTVGKNIKDFQREDAKVHHSYVDIRFENDRLVILVETKDSFSSSKWDPKKIRQQLQDYVTYEKEYSGKKIVALLVETKGNGVQTWYGDNVIIDEKHRVQKEKKILSFDEYENLCFGKVNDKIKVIDSIQVLNKKLHAAGINEKLRSQFVGTCLLALKYHLSYKGLKDTIDDDGNVKSPQEQVLEGIKRILSGLLSKSGSINKAGKLSILTNKVLDDQDVMTLSYKELTDILDYINDNVIPYINDKNTAGQDLLNLFFTTFNKYVGKSDKNQAFTPDHICSFMSEVVDVNKHSRILDPCCGSGAFLVRAMTDAIDDCDNDDERENVKRDQIYGIEYEEGAYGLSSTNMLIHGDGNSNVINASMFDKAKWIEKANVNTVLMNPPYNASKKQCNPDYVKYYEEHEGKKFPKSDPSKGWHYVKWVADHVSSHTKMAVLLPMQAAIGNNKQIKYFKSAMLEQYTLEAVFLLPDEMFYPGASAVACCMVFDLSQSHEKSNRDTFLGYFKDDKFVKRKGLGRIETTNDSGKSLWEITKQEWLDAYRNKREIPGLSVMAKLTDQDEWLAEAFMKTDYTKLQVSDFQQTLNEYLAYLIEEGNANE